MFSCLGEPMSRISVLTSVAVILSFAGFAFSWDAFPQGKIIRLDPEFDTLVAKDASIEKLADGFDWSEGTAWNKKEGFLVFSDVPRNEILRYQPGKSIEVFRKPSGWDGKGYYSGEPGSNGLLWDSQGHLVICQHGNRRVVRIESDGQTTVLADKYKNKKFNSPNDIVQKSNGELYFTDPPYGLPKQAEDPTRELDFCGVYRIGSNGKVTLLTDKMTRPNGIGLSPDEKTLYVAQSDPDAALWMAFDVKEDGTIGEGKVFHDATAAVKKGEKGLPDGLRVAETGHIFATGPGGVFVFAPDGRHLGTIHTGEANGNCSFGGDDGSTLYIAADMYLVRVPTKVKGLPWRKK